MICEGNSQPDMDVVLYAVVFTSGLFFLIFEGNKSFSWGSFFGLLVTSALCFQSQGGFLTCTLSYLHAIPRIHLWCNTC